jgi:hypothetical protein
VYVPLRAIESIQHPSSQADESWQIPSPPS